MCSFVCFDDEESCTVFSGLWNARTPRSCIAMSTRMVRQSGSSGKRGGGGE